jgi:hypothetical protein
VTVETDATVSLLTERRRHAPPGAAGGRDGATSRNLINGEPTPAKKTREVEAGTTVRIETPGGGWGDPDERDEAARDADRADGKVDGDGGLGGAPSPPRSVADAVLGLRRSGGRSVGRSAPSVRMRRRSDSVPDRTGASRTGCLPGLTGPRPDRAKT